MFEIEKAIINENVDEKDVETTSPETGNSYPVPDNPLTLPPRRTETSIPQTGYNYPTPDNPLTLPPRRTTLPSTQGIAKIR